MSFAISMVTEAETTSAGSTQILGLSNFRWSFKTGNTDFFLHQGSSIKHLIFILFWFEPPRLNEYLWKVIYLREIEKETNGNYKAFYF